MRSILLSGSSFLPFFAAPDAPGSAPLGSATAHLGGNTGGTGVPVTIKPAPVATKPAASAKPATTKRSPRKLATKPGKPGSKPAAKASAKAATKPAGSSVDNTAKARVASAKAELRAIERKAVATFYNGPSLTVHANAGTKLGAIVDRIKHPTKAYNETERTGSLAARIAKHVHDKPAAASDLGFFLSSGADLGVIAMLASGGILSIRDGKPALASRAKLRACIVASLGEKHVPAGFKA